MKIPFSFLILLLLYSTATSQVSGYQGKKFIVRADLVDVIFNDGYAFGVEVAIGRYLGLTVEFANRIQEFENLNPTSDFEGIDNERAINSTRHVGMGMRFYKNRVFPAPKGGYLFFNAALGVSDADITYNLVENGRVSKRINTQIEEYIYFNAELGVGRQSIFVNRLVLDVGLGINSSDFLIEDGNLTYIYADPLATRQGQNLGGFKVFGEFYVAISGHFSVGFLLF